jgi:hypothetical protein
LHLGSKGLGYHTYANAVDLYNVTSGTWSTAQLSAARSLLAATSVGNVAIFAGGLFAADSNNVVSNVVDLYNVVSGTWSTAQLSVARSYLAATSVGNVAIFAGGFGYSWTDAVDLYNSASGTWSTAQLSERRFGLAATSVENVAMFAGGFLGNSRFSMCVERLLFDGAVVCG